MSKVTMQEKVSIVLSLVPDGYFCEVFYIPDRDAWCVKIETKPVRHKFFVIGESMEMFPNGKISITVCDKDQDVLLKKAAGILTEWVGNNV